jgi:hypothetical protein
MNAPAVPAATAPAKHSSIVGGSTAKRVMNCPGSVALVAQAPVRGSSVYADRGTLLHAAITEVLDTGCTPESLIGLTYESEVLDADLVAEKLRPALAALDAIDPEGVMELVTETEVSFGDYMPGVFGSADVLGRIGTRAIVLDWKFGDGVAVEATENEQGMFYAAAAMRTPAAAWVFDGATEIEIIIVQPPAVKRWVTTKKRIRTFELALKRAVKGSEKWDAPIKQGEWCRWCAAKPTCPMFTGAVDRALKLQIDAIDRDMVGRYLDNASLLEQWITDLRALAFEMANAGAAPAGWKLVAKKSRRQWVDEFNARGALLALGVNEDDVMDAPALKSPAQVEKVLKSHKLALPDDLVASISSGSTLAPESDPRPPVLLIGQQLTAALSKLS